MLIKESEKDKDYVHTYRLYCVNQVPEQFYAIIEFLGELHSDLFNDLNEETLFGNIYFKILYFIHSSSFGFFCLSAFNLIWYHLSHIWPVYIIVPANSNLLR